VASAHRENRLLKIDNDFPGHWFAGSIQVLERDVEFVHGSAEQVRGAGHGVGRSREARFARLDAPLFEGVLVFPVVIAPPADPDAIFGPAAHVSARPGIVLMRMPMLGIVAMVVGMRMLVLVRVIVTVPVSVRMFVAVLMFMVMIVAVVMVMVVIVHCPGIPLSEKPV
jgi:hypothetical protein